MTDNRDGKKKEPRFHIVKRDALPWYKAVGIRIIAIVLALVLCGIITTITTGIDPIKVYESIFAGAFGTTRKTWITLQNTSILLLISLALTPAFIILPYSLIYKQKISFKEVIGTVVSLVGVAMFFL